MLCVLSCLLLNLHLGWEWLLSLGDRAMGLCGGLLSGVCWELRGQCCRGLPCPHAPDSASLQTPWCQPSACQSQVNHPHPRARISRASRPVTSWRPAQVVCILSPLDLLSGWVLVSKPDSDLLSPAFSPPVPLTWGRPVQSLPTPRRPSPARVPSTRAHGATDFSLSSREDPFLLPALQGPGQTPPTLGSCLSRVLFLHG